ncbi:MAG TPA: MOSC N-terminal beta barrel domain-containing protein [Pyrinomonadaceae bacterium]|nr:MOSC N-terminal beta barrel domain-containing protein [Pyrinomonadaceae bacterium]
MIIGKIQQIWRYPVKSMSGQSLDDCAVGVLGLSGDRGWALRDEKTKEVTNGKRIPLLMQCAARYREEPESRTIPHVDITCHDDTLIGSDEADVNEKLSKALGKTVSLWPLQAPTNKRHYRRASFISRLSRFKVVRDQLPRLLRLRSVDAQLRETFSRDPGEPLPDLLQLPPEVLEFTSPLGTYFDAYPIHLLTTSSLKAMAGLNSAAAWDVRRFRPNFLIETVEGIEGLIEAGWGGRHLRIGALELKCEIPTVRCGMTTHAQAGLPKDPSVLRSIVKDANQNLGIYASVLTASHVAVNEPVELF